MSVSPGRWRWAIAMAAVAAIGACAPYPAAPPGGTTPASPNPTGAGSPTSRPAPASTSTGRGTVASTMPPADTVLTRDAAEVLASIPEPLSAAERVAPPDVPPAGAVSAVPPASASAPPATIPADRSPTSPGAASTDSSASPPPSSPAPDSAAAAPPDTATAAVPSLADSGEAAVPIPSPTYALGLEPPRPPDTTAADTSGAAGAAARPSAPSASGTARPSSGTRPSGPPAGLLDGPAPRDTCWRVQVGAPDQKAKGESVRAASESLLLVPMVVEREGGLYKVRTRDCQSRSTAEAIKRRAEQSGFKGSFRFVGRRP